MKSKYGGQSIFLNILTLAVVGFNAGLLYQTALDLARCT